MKEDDRGYLLTEGSTRKIAENVLRDFQKLFPGSNVDPIEVHIYRRGHPLYMSTPGLYTTVQPLGAGTNGPRFLREYRLGGAGVDH